MKKCFYTCLIQVYASRFPLCTEMKQLAASEKHGKTHGAACWHCSQSLVV